MEPKFDPYAARNRVIRQRNIALGLVLAFFVVLFFAITIVKMKHVKMPHRRLPASTLAPPAGGMNGH
jgi:hypothetical protein